MTVAAMKYGSRITTLIGLRDVRDSSAMRWIRRSACPRVTWRATGKTSPSSSVTSTRQVPSGSSRTACDQFPESPCIRPGAWLRRPSGRLVAPPVVFAVRVDAMAEEPFAARAMQILEIGPGHDHAVQQLLELVLRLLLHIGNLLRIPKPLRRLQQKRPQSHNISSAQNAAELGYVGWLTWRHRRVAPRGLEPPASDLGNRRSVRMSYGAAFPSSLLSEGGGQSWRRARCSAVRRRHWRKPVWSSRPSRKATIQPLSRSRNSSVSAGISGNLSGVKGWQFEYRQPGERPI